MTWHHFINDTHFSVWLALLRLTDECGGRIGLTRISKWARHRKDNWILSYLETVFAPVITQYKSLDIPGNYQENAPIWVCWWQGEEQAPELVKQCIRSIRRHAGNHPVHLITQHNYKQYLHIPDYLLKKVSSNQMCLAHFSDYIRVSLIEQCGGLWLDATIFCSQDIPESFFSHSFFTCKGDLITGFYLSNYQWTTFCLGGWKGNLFYRFIKDAFEAYWKNENRAIDYLFFDHIIYIAKKHIPAIETSLEFVPKSNSHINSLQEAMNCCLRADDFDSVIKPDTTFYKLSWRESYSKFTLDNHESIYSYFLNLKI